MNRINLKMFTGKWVVLLVLPLIIATGSFLAAKQYAEQEKVVEASACEARECISLTESGATPAEITIPAGSYVQFNSRDGKTHNMSLGQGGEEHDHKGPFHSGEFKGDEAWKVQFKEDGSYYFHDHYNPKINVLVVVYTEGKDYKIPAR